MDWLTDPNIWISLVTLTVLEIVLGIDNIIFISILSGKLPAAQQAKARTTGLMLALVTRILLLCSIFWIANLTDALFSVFHHPVSGKDLVMLTGGLFLIWKSVHEIHGSLEGEGHGHSPNEEATPSVADPQNEISGTVGGEGRKRSPKAAATMSAVITQIILIDIVFSLDSVITAVGLVKVIGVMIAAVVLAMIVMLAAAGPISNYVNRHPTIKMLALSFLLLVGVVLIGDGLGQHIEKGYIYFAMAFSFGVEMLNIRARAKQKPVELRQKY